MERRQDAGLGDGSRAASQRGAESIDVKNLRVPRRGFVVLGSYRSGSTWLAELIFLNTGVDCRREHLANPRRAYWQAKGELDLGVEARSVRDAGTVLINGFETWSTKLMWGDKNYLSQLWGLDSRSVDGLDSAFDDFGAVLIRRRDVVAQGVSLWLAKASGQWHRYESSLRENLEWLIANFDYTAVSKQVSQCGVDYWLWSRYVHRHSSRVELVD